MKRVKVKRVSADHSSVVELKKETKENVANRLSCVRVCVRTRITCEHALCTPLSLQAIIPSIALPLLFAMEFLSFHKHVSSALLLLLLLWAYYSIYEAGGLGSIC